MSSLSTNRNTTIVGASLSSASVQLDIKNSGVNVQVKDDNFSRYNFFVRQYNETCNIVDNTNLAFIPVPKLLCTLRGCCPIWIFLLAICPCISFFIFILSIYFLIVLLIIFSKVYNNRCRVRDPFNRMIYCESSQFINEYIDVSAVVNYKELEVYGISTETFNLASARLRNDNIDGGTVRVMFYTSNFKKYETSVLSCMALKIIYFIILISLSGFMTTVSAIVIATNIA